MIDGPSLLRASSAKEARVAINVNCSELIARVLMQLSKETDCFELARRQIVSAH